MTGLPTARVDWVGARRIISTRHPPIDLFEDVADPADWPLLISLEQKNNPRLMEGLGQLALVPPARRVGGPGASYLMAPFTHVSVDRPSRFSAGDYGVLYAAHEFETALSETIHHHEELMAATAQAEGWAAQFRELVFDIAADLSDCRGLAEDHPILSPVDYAESQKVATDLRTSGSDGIIYPSVRNPGGTCAALFYPDLGSMPVQGRHVDYHWNGTRVDYYRDAGTREVFEVR